MNALSHWPCSKSCGQNRLQKLVYCHLSASLSEKESLSRHLMDNIGHPEKGTDAK